MVFSGLLETPLSLILLKGLYTLLKTPYYLLFTEICTCTSQTVLTVLLNSTSKYQQMFY